MEENTENVGANEPLAFTYGGFAQVATKARGLPIPRAKRGIPLVPSAEWVQLDWVIFNTHVGAGVRNGALQWIIDRWKPNVILAQEVKNANLNPFKQDWHVIWYGHNAILARKSEFALVDEGGPDIRFGSQYVRNQTHAVLLHRKTRRVFYVQDIHLDPLYGQPDISQIRDTKRLASHVSQGNTYIKWQTEHKDKRGAVRMDGGDTNELVKIDHLKKKPKFLAMSLTSKYSKIGMVPAHSKLPKGEPTGTVRIDELYVSDKDYVNVVGRTSVDLRQEFHGLDHNTVRVRTEIRVRRKWAREARRMMQKL